jgi:hypothetical protein
MSLEDFDSEYENLFGADVEFKEDKRRDDNMKWELELSMVKGFNRVAVNVREISDFEFEPTRDKALERVREAWALIPSSEDKKGNHNAKKPYVQSKPTYEQKASTPQQYGQTVTSDDVATMSKFVKGGQLNIIRQGINKGVLTVNEVQGMSKWQDGQALIQRVFDSGKYDKNDRG